MPKLFHHVGNHHSDQGFIFHQKYGPHLLKPPR